MGKKKVSKQDSSELLKESAAVESAISKSSAKSVSKKADSGRVYIKASYNNTVVTVTDKNGNVLAWATAGALGFKGPKKATPFAASKIIDSLNEKLQKSGLKNVDIYLSGIGGGRDSAIRSIINHGYEVKGIYDVTPIPHNGPRPKKVRRV
jgi:small subunit ribosomal protein S11